VSFQIGSYFWVLLTELLALVWEPEKQNERLIVMTTRLFGWGIRYVSPEIGMRSVSRFMLPKNSFRMLDIVEITFFGCW
jgi:hypothetical protein